MNNAGSGTLNILLVLTGGTICSFADAETGKRDTDVARAQTLIVSNFRKSGSPLAQERKVSFDTRMPLDILSENMTTGNWNRLISQMKEYDYSAYDGVIILHGTDTLAYTASLLSLLMAGTKIPVFLVSSQLPPYDDAANGNANFRAAVELIAGGVRPNVYAVYRNGDDSGQTMYVHYGAHLNQCANRSDNFFSDNMTAVSEDAPEFAGVSSGERDMLLYSVGEITPCVLRLSPYVGIDYDRFDLTGVKAVLHGTYHSSTMCVDPYIDPDESPNHSILSLEKRCAACEPPVPMFIEHCNPEAYSYRTTGVVLAGGAVPLWQMTSEMTYVKLLVGCALGLEGDGLKDFLNTPVNNEMLYQ